VPQKSDEPASGDSSVCQNIECIQAVKTRATKNIPCQNGKSALSAKTHSRMKGRLETEETPWRGIYFHGKPTRTKSHNWLRTKCIIQDLLC
jgi:hypothetical protein